MDTKGTAAPEAAVRRFEIRHRGTNAVLFEGQFATMRLCVEAAVRSGADLSYADLGGARLPGADLGGADLCYADLRGADLRGANLGGAIWRDGVKLNRAPVKTVDRSDGYEFRLLDTDQGWRVAAGCRFFTLDEAWRHWGHGVRADTPLGLESEDILVLFEHTIEREAAARSAAR